MHYGGWTPSTSECGRTNDGPSPDDPGWRLVRDEHGCERWSSAGTGPGGCGGDASLADTGTDADAAPDAAPDVADTNTSDAPACPTLLPPRRTPCTQLDQVCFYGCGIVMRCTADGWDYDPTIDGGPPCP